MSTLLHLSIVVPITGFLVSLVVGSRHERALSWVAFITAAIQAICITALTLWWAFAGFEDPEVRELPLFTADHYEFFVALRFDKITAVYGLVGAILTFLVMVYSRTYLHRENGYKRFFNNTLFFYTGYNVVVFASNLETLFVGWEILGISSFLLIAFYRHRYLPVKNAVKVFSIYRVADVGLLLAMWLSHHLWAGNITFDLLSNQGLVAEQLQKHSAVGVLLSAMILLSAAAKSAQLPFSSWLPRAMEGPTPSSAIFYGSLSVHIGGFLLMRTFPFWEHQASVRVVIGLVGLFTALVASGIARTQSSVKSQIAYSSIAQIGLMFIELALGLLDIALFHFAGNAFLRTYQLLVSPSVVTYLIREQFYNFVPRQHSFEDSLPRRLEYALYVLCLKEWNLDTMMYRYLWNPLKKLGNRLRFINVGTAVATLILFIGIAIAWLKGGVSLPMDFRAVLSSAAGMIALACTLRAFTERVNVKMSWLLIIMNHFLIATAISFNETFSLSHIILYLSGIVIFGPAGWICLRLLRLLERHIDLDRFNGHAYMHPGLAFTFLVCCLALAGFPITPTFMGEDLILTHIRHDQLLLATLVALSFVTNGLAIVRIYARVFLGPHVHSAYDMAYRSS